MRPIDRIVLTLTIFVVVTIAVIAVAPVFTGKVRNKEEEQILYDLYTIIIAIITMYVGSKLNKQEK